MKANAKKLVALGLAAAMVFGSCITVLADDNSGSSTGTGTSEGHVDEKATNVVLPTIASGETPFAYIMDPEGLIAATSSAAHAASSFPTSGDTRVYFNNGKVGGDGADKDNTNYLNTSLPQTVTNKSSHAISLTVTATATSADTDIPLVAQSALSSATEASLYLGLKVGSEDEAAIAKDTPAEKTVTINGTAANFKIAYNSTTSKYEYRALSLDEYQALDGNSDKTQADYDATWATSTIQLKGATTSGKKITSTTTAPTVGVTWSWTDPSALQPTLASTADYTIGGEDDLEIALTNTTSVTSVKLGDDTLTATDDYTFADSKLTLKAEALAAVEEAGDVVLTVVASNANVTEKSLTCTITFEAAPDPYADAESITLTKGSTAVYESFANLGFAASDITATKVKVDSENYADITRVSSDTALKFNIESSWSSATSVKIYVVTASKVYVYTYK